MKTVLPNDAGKVGLDLSYLMADGMMKAREAKS